MGPLSGVISVLAYGALFAVVLGIAGVLIGRTSLNPIQDYSVAVRVWAYGGFTLGALLGAGVGIMRSRRR